MAQKQILDVRYCSISAGTLMPGAGAAALAVYGFYVDVSSRRGALLTLVIAPSIRPVTPRTDVHDPKNTTWQDLGSWTSIGYYRWPLADLRYSLSDMDATELTQWVRALLGGPSSHARNAPAHCHSS